MFFKFVFHLLWSAYQLATLHDLFSLQLICRITEFDEKNILHLPMPEHESLLQKCINKETTPWSEDACMTPPDHIYHWSHEHQLLLENTSASTTINEKGILTICNGCTESISTNDNVFYECSECDYVLHQYCAMLPKDRCSLT